MGDLGKWVRRVFPLVPVIIITLAGPASGAPMTVRASVDAGGGDTNGNSFNTSISAKGRFVAFDTFASDLVPGDGNGATDVFVRDLVAATTIRASVDTGGGDPNGFSESSSISATGRFVGFESGASDLVTGDGNRLKDIFVRRLPIALG
jgi:hypothetical protein